VFCVYGRLPIKLSFDFKQLFFLTIFIPISLNIHLFAEFPIYVATLKNFDKVQQSILSFLKHDNTAFFDSGQIHEETFNMDSVWPMRHELCIHPGIGVNYGK
jgi:hypothetical protein